jgi:hypothetical protein
MNKRRVGRLVAIGTTFLMVVPAVLLGLGEGVEHLWNWLMPEIFGLHAISFWQALGLMLLSWILFGGFGWLNPRPRRYASANRMGERWEQMTPEQRATFREGLRGRCGHRETTEPQPQQE